MKKVIALLMALVLVLSLVACGGSGDSSGSGSGSGFVGSKWVGMQTKQTIEFKGDGKLTWSGVDGTWTENEGLITVNYVGYNGENIECYFDVLEEEGSTVLKIKENGKIDGEPLVFTVETFYPEDKAETVRSSTVKQLGDTVSTDIVDFTLKEADLSFYASALHDETYAKPIDKSDGGIFKAAKGRVLVCLTFSIKNNDRDYLDAGGYFADWGMYFTIVYNNSNYAINGFDLNEKDGKDCGLSFGEAEISYDGGTSYTQNSSGNIMIDAGRTATVKVVGIAKFEPENLNDPFDLIVNIPNSDDGMEYFTYEVK